MESTVIKDLEAEIARLSAISEQHEKTLTATEKLMNIVQTLERDNLKLKSDNNILLLNYNELSKKYNVLKNKTEGLIEHNI